MARELAPWTPFQSLSALRRDMDDIFNRFFSPWEQERSPWWRLSEGFAPPLECAVEGNQCVVKADLPGIDPKDIEVSVLGNQLTIKGERKARQEQKDRDYFQREVHYGTFARTITLPEGVKADDVKASYRDGVLEIALPCSPSMSAKKIPIEAMSEERTQRAA
jgi:HSP20 family protein